MALILLKFIIDSWLGLPFLLFPVMSDHRSVLSPAVIEIRLCVVRLVIFVAAEIVLQEDWVASLMVCVIVSLGIF